METFIKWVFFIDLRTNLVVANLIGLMMMMAMNIVLNKALFFILILFITIGLVAGAVYLQFHRRRREDEQAMEGRLD